MKRNRTWLVPLLFFCSGCGKSNVDVAPEAAAHLVTFHATGSGYTVTLRLQKPHETYQQSQLLDSLHTSTDLYTCRLSLKAGEHLLIKAGPGIPPEAVLHYVINDNGVPGDSINIGNLPPGVEMLFHYPKD